MLCFEDAADYLDSVINELPIALFRCLNGGVSLVHDCKASSKAKNMLVLGQYFNNKQMGRYIFIYYGSFVRLLKNADDGIWRKRLKEVLLHELTHHNESLAGLHDLELKDEIQQEIYCSTGVYVPTGDIKLYKEEP